LTLDYLDNNSAIEINTQLSDIVAKLPGFGEVKVYFN